MNEGWFVCLHPDFPLYFLAEALNLSYHRPLPQRAEKLGQHCKMKAIYRKPE